MEAPKRKVLFIVASFLGGYLIFVLSDITNSQSRKAPPVYSNIYIVQDNPGSSNMTGDRKDLADMRKRAIQALFVSKSTLPFCKPTSNAKSKGEFLSYEAI